MHKLESVEQSLVKPTSVHLTEGFVKPKRKLKVGIKKKKKKPVVIVSKPIAMKKSKGQCFKCGQKGH